MTSTRASSARRPRGSSQPLPAPGRGGWPVRERSLLRPVLGIPPVAAIGLAVGTTALGVFVDLLRIGTVGRVFEIGYLLGCVLAVGWVRRRSIFLPAVQPPLLLAVVVPLIAVLIGAPTGGGATQSVLMAGAPLINAFPAMALTTLVVALIAGFRLLRQRLGPDDAVGRLWVRLGRDPGGRDPDSPARGPGSGAANRSRSGDRGPGTARDRRTRGGEPEPRTGRGRASGSTSARATGLGRTGSDAASGTDSSRTGSTAGAPGRGVPGTGGSRAWGSGASRSTRAGGARPSSTTRGGEPDRTRRRSR